MKPTRSFHYRKKLKLGSTLMRQLHCPETEHVQVHNAMKLYRPVITFNPLAWEACFEMEAWQAFLSNNDRQSQFFIFSSWDSPRHHASSSMPSITTTKEMLPSAMGPHDTSCCESFNPVPSLSNSRSCFDGAPTSLGERFARFGCPDH